VLFLSVCIPLKTTTAPLTTVMKATDQVREALRVDLAWAVVYVALIVLLGPVLGLLGIGLATLAACIVQLTLAVRLSRLSIGIRFVSSVVVRILIGVSLAMVPLIVVTALIGKSSDGLFLVLRVLLFVIGCAVYPRLLKTLQVFDAQEKERLSMVLRIRGLNGLARILWP
jgi:O-antigen/teichoic acid export membrane protein